MLHKIEVAELSQPLSDRDIKAAVKVLKQFSNENVSLTPSYQDDATYFSFDYRDLEKILRLLTSWYGKAATTRRGDLEFNALTRSVFLRKSNNGSKFTTIVVPNIDR